MRTLHFIMPMAGEGSRFRDAGWTTPKPLIEVDGKALFVRALQSVGLKGVNMKYTFIVRKEHIADHAIDEGIRKWIPDANVFSVDHTTKGAVETCMIGESSIGDEDAVMVMDCDLEFRSDSFNQLILESLQTSADSATGGVLVSFKSSLPRYSYAEIGSDGRVVRTAEKEPISDNALCGAYFFASGRKFKEAAHILLEAPEMEKPEYYLSLLYNILLKRGAEVRLASVDQYNSFGTPEELLANEHKAIK